MLKRIFSYNVNGIRAALNKGFAEWLKRESPDILCIQETKATPSQIDVPLFEHLEYNCYIHSAEKKGYSGVVILSKLKADNISVGIQNHKYDSEGRVIRADFGDKSVLSVYVPSGTTGDIRQDFKMEFLYDFKNFISELKKTRNNLIISGDYNICHKPIDINHPERHQKSSGFLPEERAWFDDYINDGLIDTFRLFNSEPNQYSWWSYRANSRAKNLGWRIDYNIVTNTLKQNVKSAKIHDDIIHSDHCPISVEIDL